MAKIEQHKIREIGSNAIQICFKADSSDFAFLVHNDGCIFRLDVMSWSGDAQTATIRLMPDNGIVETLEETNG